MLMCDAVMAAPPAAKNWDLTFEDNFEGTSLDTSKWSTGYPWGNGHTHIGNHDAYCVAENVEITDGKLVITAEYDPTHPQGSIPDSDHPSGHEYISGLITSNGKFTTKYGYIEGSFQMPAATGTWPAFWTLQSGWPPEIDILEVPHDRYTHHYYFHYSTDTGNSAFGRSRTEPVDLSAGFHTYAVEWNANEMKFYFDDQLKDSYWRPDEIAQAQYMYLLINLAVGGWAWDPIPAEYPTTYECDWVRVWQENNSTYCGDGTCSDLEDSCNCSNDCGPPPTSETVCYDGIDDDCDGLTDSDDPDCFDDCGAPGDIDLDCEVDNADFVKLALKWLDTNCGSCDGADLSGDNAVNVTDLIIMANNWTTDFSLRGHWKLDGDAVDSSYYGNDGTIYGSPTWDPNGRIDGALNFDGFDDYVKITGYRGIGGARTRTVAAWVKTNTTGDILSWGNEEAGKRWLFYVNQDGLVRISVYGGYIKGSSDVADGEWHHVAAVLPVGALDVSEIELYVDGEIETGTTYSSQAINTASYYKVKIGNLTGGTLRWFDGLIDDVRIYSRALGGDEIETLAGL